MPTGTIMPSPVFTGLDNDGNPVAGGKLRTMLAGTSADEPTYQDVELTIPHTNPIILDAAGRATVFLAEKSYKFELRSALDALIWTQDDIAAVHLGQTGGVGEVFSFDGNSANWTENAAYPAGATVDKLHEGTGIMNVDSAILPGTYKLEGVLKSDGANTVTVALVNLDDGAPDTPLVEISSTSAIGERKQSAAIAFAVAGVAKNYGIKIKVSGGAGYAWGLRIVRTV